MTELTGRRRLTCHHEAGHALARWYFGHFTDRAQVLTVEEVLAGRAIIDRRGRKIHGIEGMVDRYDIFGPTQDHRHRALIVEQFGESHTLLRDFDTSAEIELIECLAGAYAEAQFTGDDVVDIFMVAAEEDEAKAWDLVERLCDDEASQITMMECAHLRTEALIGSAQARRALANIADSLFVFGVIESAEIHATCVAAYGAQPEFGGWRDRWPPTLRQLRGGFIPGPTA